MRTAASSLPPWATRSLLKRHGVREKETLVAWYLPGGGLVGVLSTSYLGARVHLLEHEITPGSSLIEGLLDTGSSDAEGAAIALIVIRALLGGLAIGGMINNAFF